jgi:hypothetical protein
MRAAFGHRAVFQALPWECRQHSARHRVAVQRQGAAEIFPEGRKAVAQAQASPDRVRQGACRKAVLQPVSVDSEPEGRPGVLEILELFQGRPLDERSWEQQRQGGAPRAPRAEQERRREVSGE